jgi:hypothetical protein
MPDPIDEDVVRRLAASLRGARGVTGCLWTGSRERGKGRGESSDIDLIACVEESRGPKSRLGFVDWESGRAVEVLFRAPSFERRRLREHVAEGIGGLVHSYAFGRVLFGGDGPLGELAAGAKRLWEAGPEPLTSGDREWERYQAWLDLADIMERVATEPETAAHLIGLLTGRMVCFAYRLERRWYPPEKYLLADLQGHDAELAECFEAIHRDGALSGERFGGLQRLFGLIRDRWGLDFGAPYSSGDPPWRPG